MQSCSKVPENQGATCPGAPQSIGDENACRTLPAVGRNHSRLTRRSAVTADPALHRERAEMLFVSCPEVREAVRVALPAEMFERVGRRDAAKLG